MAVFGILLVLSVNRRRQLVLGYDGELATGQELDQLMLDGCYVFHDVPIDRGNVDHVVVAPSGVSAVETKTAENLDEVKTGPRSLSTMMLRYFGFPT